MNAIGKLWAAFRSLAAALEALSLTVSEANAALRGHLNLDDEPEQEVLEGTASELPVPRKNGRVKA